eukprot:scaffold66712_cov33-Phaeocystis_antarctica.AAC.2
MVNVSFAPSSPRGHPPLQRPARLLRAALCQSVCVCVSGPERRALVARVPKRGCSDARVPAPGRRFHRLATTQVHYHRGAAHARPGRRDHGSADPPRAALLRCRTGATRRATRHATCRAPRHATRRATRHATLTGLAHRAPLLCAASAPAAQGADGDLPA